MKKVIWFILAAVCLCACSESMEEKANKLIKKELNKVIVNIDTYEPIETVIDSAFAPLMTAESFNIISVLPAQLSAFSDLENEVNKLKSLMSIYERPYSAYEREQYRQYKEQYENASKRLEDFESKMHSIIQTIKDNNEAEQVFNGYRVEHQYRYTTKDGNKTIGKQIFLVNKDISAVEAKLDLENEDLKNFLEAIEVNNIGTNLMP